MGGWGEPKGPSQFEMPPSPDTGSTGRIEAARIRLHSVGIVGDDLAEEAQMAASRIIEQMKERIVNPPSGAYC